MSDRLNKKYYWFKLKKGFFNRHDLKALQNKENGLEVVLNYVKLLCESVDHEGKLRFNDDLPYEIDDLASAINTTPEALEYTMKLLQKYGLVEIDERGTIIMTKMQGMIGSETGRAEYMRDYMRDYRKQQRYDPSIEELKEVYGDDWVKHLGD